MRSLVLSGVIVSGLSALVIARQTPASVASDLPQLSYVTTAHQLGVVGYRDPVGAISPDGTRLAYAEGRFVRVIPMGGGAPVTLAPGEGQIRYLTWKGNDEVVAQDATRTARWWSYRLGDADRKPLWDPQLAFTFVQIAFSTDGRSAAALALLQTGPELVRLDANGKAVERTRLSGRVSFLTFRNSDTACVINLRVTTPCGGAPLNVTGAHEVHGPITFSTDGHTLYYSTPNERGMVELWAADLTNRRTRRLSNFSRDTYAPSVSFDGTVIFKSQTYRTHLADVAFPPHDAKSASWGPRPGGATRQLTTFQSETPSYHPTRPLIAFTYGTWRRVIDDAKYPDIAQDIGVIDVAPDVAPNVAPAFRRGLSYPAGKPSEVLEDSNSEDQAMTWSPNGKWIAFHSHKEMSDDVWLRPADGAQPDKRVTFLGRGAEVGWPRWSPDGRTVLLNGARKSDGAAVLYTIGVNQDDGRVTNELREVKVEGITGEMGHAEWMPGSASIVALAKEGPGRHVIFTVPVAGGRVSIVHRFESEHDFSGLGVSSNGRFVAFAAPAADGFFQIFVKAVGAATSPVQLTTDRSHKTQPTFAPDNSRVAFTVWSYETAFWSFRDR